MNIKYDRKEKPARVSGRDILMMGEGGGGIYEIKKASKDLHSFQHQALVSCFGLTKKIKRKRVTRFFFQMRLVTKKQKIGKYDIYTLANVARSGKCKPQLLNN